MFDRRTLHKDISPRVLAALVLALLVAASGQWAHVAAEDAPPPPPRPPLERLFEPLKQEMKDLPPFLRDTDLKAHFRTYYFYRTKPDDTINEALATGGWLGYRSGWLFDTFSIGGTIYGSAPLYAPDDRDGTLLLKPGQEGYFVPGEAWAALRYKDYAVLRGYRQLVDMGYVNPQDNRMTPNTFEAVTLGGKVGWVQYLAGYLWNIKKRNDEDFIAMSSAAGVKGHHDGVSLAGVQLTPIEGLRMHFSNAWGHNMFNTLYAEAEYLHPLSERWKLRIGAQFTDQRAVGDALLRNASERYWATQVGGVRAQAIYRELTMTTAFSITAAGNTIQSPWGSYPGYLSLIDQDFNRANEKAVLLGVAYDFARVLKGLGAYANAAWGWDAIDPASRRNAPRQAEYDLTIDYRPAWIKPAFLQGLWFRLRGAVLDQENAKRTGHQVRFIINWERDLL